MAMAAPKICVDCGQVIAGREQYYDSEKGPQHKSWLECNDALSALIATQQAELERLRAIEAAALTLADLIANHYDSEGNRWDASPYDPVSDNALALARAILGDKGED
jgi:hypothetical protein